MSHPRPQCWCIDEKAQTGKNPLKYSWFKYYMANNIMTADTSGSSNYKLLAGTQPAVDVFYEKLGQPKNRSLQRVTANYNYWVYLDHHPVINNNEDRDTRNEPRGMKYLQYNGDVAADWIKDGEFTDIFNYAKSHITQGRALRLDRTTSKENMTLPLNFWSTWKRIILPN